jgi:hypothetical protein
VALVELGPGPETLLNLGFRPDGDVFAAYYVATHYQYNGAGNITYTAGGGITPSSDNTTGLTVGDGISTPGTYYLSGSNITAIGGYIVTP